MSSENATEYRGAMAPGRRSVSDIGDDVGLRDGITEEKKRCQSLPDGVVLDGAMENMVKRERVHGGCLGATVR